MAPIWRRFEDEQPPLGQERLVWDGRQRRVRELARVKVMYPDAGGVMRTLWIPGCEDPAGTMWCVMPDAPGTLADQLAQRAANRNEARAAGPVRGRR